jgi:hypothetical protein
MKFKEDAAPKAIYKLLGIGMWLLYVQGIALGVLAFTLIIISGDTVIRAWAAGYFIGGAFLSFLGEYLRQIRVDMIKV